MSVSISSWIDYSSMCFFYSVKYKRNQRSNIQLKPMTDLGLRILLGLQNYKSSAEIMIITNTQLRPTLVAVATEARGSAFRL